MGKAKDVRAAVEAELSFDPLVNSADITVVNIGGHARSISATTSILSMSTCTSSRRWTAQRWSRMAAT